MEKTFGRVRGWASRALTTTVAASLLGLVLAAGESSLAPLRMERPDERTLAARLATDAVYRHVASYETGPGGPQ